MSDVAPILPSNVDAWEIAVAVAMSDDLPVPVAQILDPAQTPAAFLPWLAAHESVDLWFADWPEATKRAAIANAWRDAALKGTRAGAVAFLGYVGGELLDAIAYPAPFVIGVSACGVTPIAQPPFQATYLISVATSAPPQAFVIGASAVGVSAVYAPSTEPIERCLTALRAARAPETQLLADFAHHRPLTFADAPLFDGVVTFDSWVARAHL